MQTIAVIPDLQIRANSKLDYVRWIGKYLAIKQPDTIVQIGDWGEFDSLSEFDKDKKKREFYNRSYSKDITAFENAAKILDEELLKIKKYHPRKVWTEGNHDYRVERLLLAEPRLRGAIATPRNILAAHGWEVFPFLQPVSISGVTFCHLFCRSANGLVTSTKFGAPSARAQLQREMRSCVAGHKPGLDYHIQTLGDKQLRSIICGSAYPHKLDDYQTPQGNAYWRGILLLHEVKNGNFSVMEITMDYLRGRFA